MTGALIGDFSSFQAAVDGSIVKLKTFEDGASKAGASLDRASNSLSGVRIVQQAAIAVKAVEEVGGVSKLTARELAGVGATATEAVAKLTALGQAVPAGIQKLADAVKPVPVALKSLATEAAAATPPVKDLHASLSSFDGVLAAMGVHIGPEIKGLTELGSASGQTAKQLGTIATAGLVVGAAIGGWKIGRAISEFFDLDETIGNATAKLLGWGDVAGEVAGNKADQLARASARIGREVTDLNDALVINMGALQTWRDNATISAETVARWHAELAAVGGDLPSLTADLASQNFSLQELSTRYHVSVEALQLFARETTAAAAAEKAASDVIVRSNATTLHGLQELITTRRAAAAAEAAGLLELTKLQEQYAVTAISRSGTVSEIEIARINATFEVLRASLQKAGTYNAEVAAQLQADWHQALDGVGVDFNALRAYSIPTLQDIATRAQATYLQATNGSQQMSREGIEHFRALRDQAVDALHYTAAEHATMFAHMRDDVDATSFEYRSWLANVATDAEKAALALKGVTDETKRAAAEALAAAKAQANRMAGGSVDYGTVEGQAIAHDKNAATQQDYISRMGFDAGMKAWLALQDAIKRGAQALHDQGVPGFIGGGPTGGGGMSMLHPDEYVVPKGGALVMSGGRAITLNVAMTVSGVLDPRTIRDLTRGVSDELTKSMKQGGLL